MFRKLRQLDGDDLSASVALGAYAMEQGDYAEAIRLWDEALGKNPALLLVRMNLAVALLRTGHPEDARATLQNALEFNPDFPAARELLNQIRR
jgi:predicted Zn-dependent protease